jgi:hypothetical protein
MVLSTRRTPADNQNPLDRGLCGFLSIGPATGTKLA